MATIELTSASADTTINENDIVLVDFWAPWCAPCRMFGPVFERVSEKHTDTVFAKVNTEQEQDLAARFGIRAIPSLAVFREGQLLMLQSGALPEAALEQVVEKTRELDMDEIRAEIESHRRGQAS
jgi:thioredoxin 1/thioredoxin 2